jgi:dynein heavy chain
MNRSGGFASSSLNRSGALRPLPGVAPRAGPMPPAGPPPAKKDRRYPEIRQRGYYSDILGEGASERLGNVLDGPHMVPDLLWQARTEKHMPSMTTFQSPTSEELRRILREQVHGPTSQIIKETDFPERSYEPKVQVPFYTPPGSCPRKIEIERRKREFAKKNLVELLEKNGISTELLMPKRQEAGAKAVLTTSVADSKGRGAKVDPFPPILALEVFDDEDFDCRTWREWLALGDVNGVRKPVPGKALLPTVSAEEATDWRSPGLTWQWQDVGVLDFLPAKKLYLVQKCDEDGRVLDKDGKTVINGACDETHPGQFWIPRVQLMFCAENPDIFVKRVRYAFKARRKTEALLRYHLYIDCMPMDGLGELSESSFMRMLELAKGAPSIAKDYRVDLHVPTLKRQVTIDWCRAMNKIIFDKTIRADRATYSYILLPDPVVEIVPYRGCDPDVPAYNFPKQFNEFAFNSLLTREEAIQAIQRVRSECQKVASMSLFHIPMAKTQRLEEFDQTQSQASSQTSLFLKDSWITTLRAAIRTCLRDVGKGWFNLHETNWQVYQISKLKKFMDMVKFSMQDSLRYLVRDSLNAFLQMVLDACCTVMELEEGVFVWGEDVLNSQFRPLRNALFLVELILDSQGVHYSTNLLLFEQSLAALFDKGIQSTHNVPQLEKYVLEDMFWSGTPLLESVGLQEPFVGTLRDTIKHAIQQALIPMKAYAAEFERHLELMNCDVNQYINICASSKISGE